MFITSLTVCHPRVEPINFKLPLKYQYDNSHPHRANVAKEYVKGLYISKYGFLPKYPTFIERVL